MTTNPSPRFSSDASSDENTNYGSQDYQPLNVKDALAYLDKVQETFHDQPTIYSHFLQIMKEFKSQTIDTSGVIEKVSVLFKGHPSLISGFNAFLPPGYRIECLSNDVIKVTAPSPLEFNHAIHYVNKIKNRFLDQDKYQQFLDILRDYQKGEPTNKVYNQMQRLFDGQQDLLSEFKLFLPKTAENSSLSLQEDETDFFDHVKHYINNNTIYLDFLKLHNLYTQQVIDEKTLLDRSESFLGGNKELFQTYKSLLLVERKNDYSNNSSSDSSNNRKNNNHHNHNTDIKQKYPECGPSYRMIPKAWRMQRCSGRDELCYQVLNDEYVSHPTWASEDGGFIASKKNHYEEALHILEEERYSLDLNIVTSLNTISLLEVISQSLTTMTEQEKRDYKLSAGLGGSSKAMYQAVIKKVYGKEKGNEMIEMLHTNPVQTIPGLLKRLKQKHEEWIKTQRDKINGWHDIERKNYPRSLDYQSAAFKINDRKHIVAKALVTEIEAIQLDQQEDKEGGLPQFQFDTSQLSIIEDVIQVMMSYLEKHMIELGYQNEHHHVQVFINTFLYRFFDLSRDQKSTFGAKLVHRFIGNTSFYCFFRLFQMAYHRLETLRDAADDIESGKDFEKLANDLNITGKSASILQIDFKSGYYNALLQLIDQFFNEDIDQHVFEECLLYLFDIKAYILFTIDKLMLAIVKQLQSILTIPANQKLIQLFQQYKNQPVKAYCLQVAQSQSIHDQLYLLSFDTLKNDLSIEMLCNSEEVFDDEYYADYVSTFTDLEQQTKGIKSTCIRTPFLKRNRSKDNAKDIICHKTMQYKLCQNTYHLFYTIGTEHVLLRRKKKSTTPVASS